LLEEIVAHHDFNAEECLESGVSADVVLMAVHVHDVMVYTEVYESLLDSGSIGRARDAKELAQLRADVVSDLFTTVRSLTHVHLKVQVGPGTVDDGFLRIQLVVIVKLVKSSDRCVGVYGALHDTGRH